MRPRLRAQRAPEGHSPARDLQFLRVRRAQRDDIVRPREISAYSNGPQGSGERARFPDISSRVHVMNEKKVLFIADKLSEDALKILKDAPIEVDYRPGLPLDQKIAAAKKAHAL